MRRPRSLAFLACAALAATAVASAAAPETTGQAARTVTGARAGPQVSWRSWGDEALQEAAESKRPILLYISAAWDHYDQVMADLTYSDPNVIRLIQSAYVPVKVDTDARPDIFARFGMGGWPTTAVLLPDGEPLYYPDPNGNVTRAGGKFFPPDLFVSYFSQLASYWADNREAVERVTRNIDDAILAKRNVDQGEVVDGALESIVGRVLDARKVRPSTPEPGDFHPDFDMVGLTFLYWSRKADRKVLDVGLNHLTDMARGGIYDQIGGGFHRYAHDSLFIVPAFEKTPMVNAAAIRRYAEAFNVTGNGRFLDPARETVEFVRKHGVDPSSHAFIGAMAAGASSSDNGDYYTWTEDEVKAVLTESEFKVAALAWNILPLGEMLDTAPRRNVIFMAEGPKALSVRLNIEEKQAADLYRSLRSKLLAAREGRKAPRVDPRTFGDASAMMASAFLAAGRTLQKPDLIDQGLESVRLLLLRCRLDSGLITHVCDPAGGAHGKEAFLSDQAWGVAALLDAHEQSGAQEFLAAARVIADRAFAVFRDSISGGLSDRAVDPNASGLMAWPVRDLGDNMAMAEDLVRLGHLTGEKPFLDKARKILESWADEIGDYGEHASSYAIASNMLLTPPLEILIAGDPADPETAKGRERGLGLFHPWRVVRHYNLAAGQQELTKRGLKPGHGAQIAFCVGKECAGPFPAARPVRQHLDEFLNRGRAQGAGKTEATAQPGAGGGI